MPAKYEAVIIGSASNALASGFGLFRQGFKAIIFLRASKPNGTTRTKALTLAGFRQDVDLVDCLLPQAFPILVRLALKAHRVQWVYSPRSYTSSLSDGTAQGCYPGLEGTADSLGEVKHTYLELSEHIREDSQETASSLRDFLPGDLPVLAPNHQIDKYSSSRPNWEGAQEGVVITQKEKVIKDHF